MRHLVLPMTALLLAACATTPRYEERVTLLDPALGERATTTCSRSGPESPSRFFTPSANEITAVESAAMRLLRERADEYAPLIGGAAADGPTPFDWPADPSLYARQYIGYYEDGRRMLYGNYFPASPGFDASEPFVICDGGFRFFGVEYDVGAKAVRRLGFDGTRGGILLPAIEP